MVKRHKAKTSHSRSKRSRQSRVRSPKQFEHPCLEDVLHHLYEDEINVQIHTFWDGGFQVQIGDEENRIAAEKQTDNLESSIDWLIAEVPKHYPESEFAKWVAAQMKYSKQPGLKMF